MTDHAPGLSVSLRENAPIPLDLAFSVRPGEVFALVGPSGSGKSTTLRSIAGLYRPQSGRITSANDCWLDTASEQYVAANRRRIGLVFQSYALFPHLDALANVTEAMGDRPRSERHDAAMKLLARVHLDGLENRLPRQLSGGQQQRVAVARALARRPDVLLLDEPFAAVDRMTRNSLQRELIGLRADLDMPVVLVTHDLDEAARLADRIGVLVAGKLLQTGNVADVMQKPVCPTVARIIGLPNILTGIVSQTAHGIDWNGQILHTDNILPLPGTDVSFCLRPDAMDIGPKGTIPATIMERTILGAICEIRLAVQDDILTLHVPLRDHDRPDYTPGTITKLAIAAHAIHIMANND
ncbi:MAG: ABC transporter ATP-binding protein [Pseudomonadota bacterium]